MLPFQSIWVVGTPLHAHLNAGLHYGVDSSVVGWQLSGSGYSHKVLHLVHIVLDCMMSLEVDPLRFEVRDCHVSSCSSFWR